MQKQSWTIGSDSSCDLVVKNNTVSGQHCRLTVDATGLTLTDLGSTNGTFVNGKRIVESQAINKTDRITLGQSHPMPWPEGLQAADKRGDSKPPTAKPPAKPATVITLGRGADNTITLADHNVSTHHARLIIDGQQMLLEDLGSTNGTAIGKVENKISRAAVRANDTVFFGSTAYQVSDWLNRSPSAQPAPAIRAVQAGRTPKASFHKPATFAAIACIGMLLVWMGWLILRDREGTVTVQSETPDVSAIASVSTVDKELPNTPAPEPKPSPAPVAKDINPTPRELAVSAKETLAASLFLIVCSDAERETAFRVGTGFAFDAQHIATSASAIQAMHDLQQNGFPQAYLFSPATDRDLEIASVVIHPRYQQVDLQARQAQQEHDSIFDQLESQPPKPEAFEEVKDRLIAARVKALEAIDQKTAYDAALIKVSQPLPQWLPGSAPDTSLRPNQKLDVTGCAFDVQDPYFDRAVPVAPATLSSRVVRLLKVSAAAPQRLLATGRSEQQSLAFLGSPVLNTQGQVVGIYSRPALATAEQDPEHDFLFDAALYQRLRECPVP